jgi:hypothetical protein
MDTAKILLLVNLPAIALMALSGWFAYLDNGYWGWPFVMAILMLHGFKSAKDRYEEEKEIEIQRQKDIKKYGDILKNVGKN